MGDFEDYSAYEPEEAEQAEQEARRDLQIDIAKRALKSFFEKNPTGVFYERQLEVIHERDFFHWISRKALYELRDEGYLALNRSQLNEQVSINLYRKKTNRYWRHQGKRIVNLVRAFSDPSFTEALGRHGEQMFDAALPRAGFVPKESDVRAYNGRTWTTTGHNLDRVFERDGVGYGTEIKNTLSYIKREELKIKIEMCRFLGLRPLFIVRMAPKSYIEDVRKSGGFTLIFKYQLYPHGHADLAKQVQTQLQLPVDCPSLISKDTRDRFLTWHLNHLV